MLLQMAAFHSFWWPSSILLYTHPPPPPPPHVVFIVSSAVDVEALLELVNSAAVNTGERESLGFELCLDACPGMAGSQGQSIFSFQKRGFSLFGFALIQWS